MPAPASAVTRSRSPGTAPTSSPSTTCAGEVVGTRAHVRGDGRSRRDRRSSDSPAALPGRRHPIAVRRRQLRPRHHQRSARAHPGRRRARSPSSSGCSSPAARSPPRCRRGCRRRSTGCSATSTTRRRASGGHVRIYSATELKAKLRSAGLAITGSHHAHALHSPYWWLKCAVGVRRDDHRLVEAYRRLLEWEIIKQPRRYEGRRSSCVARARQELRRLRPEGRRHTAPEATRPVARETTRHVAVA